MQRIWMLLACFLQLCCAGQANQKINGVSFVASHEQVVQEHIQEVVNLNANYASVMPFGFIRSVSDPQIIFDTDRQWYGETRKGAAQYIKMLQNNGIQVMMKPQIWLWRGEFTGKMEMQTEDNWKVLEQSYEDFITTYARLAQEMHISIYCVGTELELFVKNRPGFWKELIKKVRGIYDGKLTYAANWDEFTRTSFWDDLDYIGIDAYFPICEDQTPTLARLKLGWKKHKSRIEAFAKVKNRPVLFTEYGYRSADYAAKKPWMVERGEEKVNLMAQVNATQALLEEFWNEEWFAGGFVWKWFMGHKQAGGESDNRYTPQNKPAQLVIRDFYGHH